MCIIAGYSGNKPAAPILIEMLKKAEYIDGGLSTGIATIHEGKLYMRKQKQQSSVPTDPNKNSAVNSSRARVLTGPKNTAFLFCYVFHCFFSSNLQL